MKLSAFRAVVSCFAMSVTVLAWQYSSAAAQRSASAQELSAPTVASETIQPTTPSDIHTFSTRVREVSVVFSVSDWRGRFVPDLKSSEMKVLDNGEQPSSLTYFLQQSEAPLRIGVLIDVSSSINAFFASEQKAAILFLQQTLRPNDSGMIASFSDRAQLAQDLTPKMDLLTKAVRSLHSGGPSTAIYDAVKFACEALSRGSEDQPARRVLILLTDGEENSSHASLDDAVFAALDKDVVLFALNTQPRAEGHDGGVYPWVDSADRRLARLVNTTGGRVLHAGGTGDMKRAFQQINQQVRNQYMLGYKPPHWIPDRSFHTIRVIAQRHHVHVHCRKGYYAVE